MTGRRISGAAPIGFEVVPDTDVLLSRICVGERDHGATVEAFRHWQRHSSPALLADGVLHELAHHAWISKYDFNSVRSWLPGSEADGDHLIDNAFVRAFAAMIRGKRARLREWSTFIRTYRGKNQADGSSLRRIIIHDYGFEELPPGTAAEQRIQDRVFAKREADIQRRDLSDHRRRREPDKARRDAELGGAISRRRRAAEADKGYGSCCLVTSSRRLAEIAAEVADDAGPVPVAIPFDSWLVLISLLPDSVLSLKSLGALLFAGRPFDRPRGLERSLLRGIRAAGSYDMPWATRTVLAEHMEEALARLAKEFGVGKRKLERIIFEGEETETRTQAVTAIAQQAVSASPLKDRESEGLREKIADLLAENEKLRADVELLEEAQKDR